jgi:hypothetical protein
MHKVKKNLILVDASCSELTGYAANKSDPMKIDLLRLQRFIAVLQRSVF